MCDSLSCRFRRHPRGIMCLGQQRETRQLDMLQARLDQIINMEQKLVQVARTIDWRWIDDEFAPLFSDKGWPGLPSRFAVDLLILKHIYTLSDDSARGGSMNRAFSGLGRRGAAGGNLGRRPARRPARRHSTPPHPARPQPPILATFMPVRGRRNQIASGVKDADASLLRRRNYRRNRYRRRAPAIREPIDRADGRPRQRECANDRL